MTIRAPRPVVASPEAGELPGRPAACDGTRAYPDATRLAVDPGRRGGGSPSPESGCEKTAPAPCAPSGEIGTTFDE